jgi:hypothetical protein
MKYSRELINQLWSGKPLPRNENGVPVYRPGQEHLATSLWLVAKWSSEDAAAAVEKLDRVPDSVLCEAANRIVELIQEAEPMPNVFMLSGMDTFMRESIVQQYKAKWKPRPVFTLEDIAGMCIAAMMATYAVVKRPARPVRRRVTL